MKQVINDVKLELLKQKNHYQTELYGFLERSELVGKTTFTVAENLILGCLIVCSGLVAGELASGLVVALLFHCVYYLRFR
jgi:cobalt-zinc-cadmium resistance protein CzcA